MGLRRTVGVIMELFGTVCQWIVAVALIPICKRAYAYLVVPSCTQCVIFDESRCQFRNTSLSLPNIFMPLCKFPFRSLPFSKSLGLDIPSFSSRSLPFKFFKESRSQTLKFLISILAIFQRAHISNSQVTHLYWDLTWILYTVVWVRSPSLDVACGTGVVSALEVFPNVSFCLFQWDRFRHNIFGARGLCFVVLPVLNIPITVQGPPWVVHEFAFRNE